MTLNRMIKGIKKAETLLVTPKVEAFLRDYPEGARFDEGTQDLIRQITEAWKGNNSRGGRFGASSRGKCYRRQIFTYLSMPSEKIIDAEQQNLFNDGKWRHLRWQVMGVESGALTHVEYTYSIPELRVGGAMDGLNSYEDFGFELKGDRRWSRALDGVPDDHLLQIGTMQLATGWDRFVYVIEDKASQQWREVIVRRDKTVLQRVRAELEELNDYVEDHRLPPVLPACAAKEGPYRSCPFSQNCLDRAANGDYWPVYPGDWTS